MARAALRGRSIAWLLGLDRSGPPPAETLPGQPLRPWTLPNAIGFARLALVPAFLAVAFASGDGRSLAAAALYGAVMAGDYLDGLTARLTGQYSRLGTLLDPLVDRLVVVSGVAVAWHFHLLPRWALAVLVGRELAMLALARLGMARGLDVQINWPGRIAVAPIMLALWLALVADTRIADALLYAGLALALLATALYVKDGMRASASA